MEVDLLAMSASISLDYMKYCLYDYKYSYEILDLSTDTL